MPGGLWKAGRRALCVAMLLVRLMPLGGAVSAGPLAGRKCHGCAPGSNTGACTNRLKHYVYLRLTHGVTTLSLSTLATAELRPASELGAPVQAYAKCSLWSALPRPVSSRNGRL